MRTNVTKPTTIKKQFCSSSGTFRQSIAWSACTILHQRNPIQVLTLAKNSSISNASTQSNHYHSFSPSNSRPVNQIRNEMKCEFKRLPTNVVPKHYNLELTPCLTSFTFDGKTSVNFKVSRKKTYFLFFSSLHTQYFFLYYFVFFYSHSLSIRLVICEFFILSVKKQIFIFPLVIIKPKPYNFAVVFFSFVVVFFWGKIIVISNDANRSNATKFINNELNEKRE